MVPSGRDRDTINATQTMAEKSIAHGSTFFPGKNVSPCLEIHLVSI